MKHYTPNERIVARAADLWVAMLARPKYDNLGANSLESRESKDANGMASILATLIPKNNTPDVLQRFGEELRKILMAPLDWEYKNSHSGQVTKHSTLFDSLHTDYGPDIPLVTAAERAGLKMEFPWKTGMFLSENHLSVSHGYGAPYVYHYALYGERWLVTTLHGDDISKIIALVESGSLTENLTLADGQNAKDHSPIGAVSASNPESNSAAPIG